MGKGSAGCDGFGLAAGVDAGLRGCAAAGDSWADIGSGPGLGTGLRRAVTRERRAVAGGSTVRARFAPGAAAFFFGGRAAHDLSERGTGGGAAAVFAEIRLRTRGAGAEGSGTGASAALRRAVIRPGLAGGSLAMDLITRTGAAGFEADFLARGFAVAAFLRRVGLAARVFFAGVDLVFAGAAEALRGRFTAPVFRFVADGRAFFGFIPAILWRCCGSERLRARLACARFRRCAGPR